MARRKVAAEIAKLTAVKNQVRGSAHPFAAISKARGTIPASEMQALIDWLPLTRRNGRAVALGQFAKSIVDVCSSGTLASVSLAREVAWASGMILNNAEALSRFSAMADEYEAGLLGSDFAQCREVLDRIETSFGVSLWSIETRVALLQLAEGLEAQKAYAVRVLEARGRNDIVAFLTHRVSRRNEPNTTPMRYIHQIEESLAEWVGAQDLATYVAYRIINRGPVDADGYAQVLRFEASAAPVDQYDTFVRLANSAAAGGDDAVRAAFRAETLRIANVVDDERLRRAAFLLSGDAAWLDRSPTAETAADDALVIGDYQLAGTFADREMARHPLDTSAWLIKAQAAVGAGENVEDCDLRSTVIDRARRLIGRLDQRDEAVIALLKDGLNHRLQRFASALDALAWEELSSVLQPPGRFASHGFCDGRILRTTDLARVTRREERVTLAKRMIASGGPSMSLADQVLRANLDCADLTERLTSTTAALPAESVLEARTVQALECGQNEIVLELAEPLLSTADLPRRRRAKRFVGHALLQLGRIAELASFIARSCVDDPELADVLPLTECASALDGDLRRAHPGDLAVPIVLDLFSKRIADTRDDVRSYAYEDFLLAHSLERPSQLDGVSKDFDRDLLVHYLRHICVPEVMQVSSVFQGTRELEDERKKVLSLLVKFDPDSAKDYENELRDVTRAQLIHRGVRHVERSKIFVDVPAIRRAFEKKHRETFQRYQALSRAGIRTSDRELEDALQDALSGKALPQQVLEVPKNESNDLLLEMVRWLFIECTANPEHGLDCYLSMRIRHGTLSGQLRTPLEVERVITQRAAGTEEYESNEHWLAQLAHLPYNACEAIDARLAKEASMIYRADSCDRGAIV